MLELTTPRGMPVAVPETTEEGPTQRFRPEEREAIRSYYEENGYVVVAGVLPAEVCDTTRKLWADDVKSAKQFIYRQATAKAERHVFNENGWVMNPILNLQSIDPRRLGRFRKYATENVLTAPGVSAIMRLLLGDTPKIVQSMYFEGNSATPEHQDTYYLDSEHLGRMVAAWIALEPIEPEAGRFFIVPRSHAIEFEERWRENNIASNHEEYIASLLERVKSMGLEFRAPRLEKGDVLFWNSRTIHGSLDTQHERHSRSSITCHAIAQKDRFLQLHMRVQDLSTDVVNGVQVYRPKDLARPANRALLWVEGNFPRQFYALKRMAIKQLSKRNALQG